MIPRIHASLPQAEAIPAWMDKAGAPFLDIACINWPDYPYKPQMQARLAITDDALLVHYRVSEQAVRATTTDDGGNVWFDSCAELFLNIPGTPTYYNIECNCIGTLLIARGDGRNNRVPIPAAELALADRWTTLGRQPFGLIETPTQWQLALMLPFTIFGQDAERIFHHPELRGNIYKCGDMLPTPHFVTLFPIHTPTPDYHVPQFFDTLGSIETK